MICKTRNIKKSFYLKGEKKIDVLKGVDIEIFKNDFIANMGDRANHKPDELSGGEQQRIAIARALINEPSLLFADEPTGSLDDTNSKNIIVLLKELRDEFNLTCLIATHSNEIAKAAEKIYYIKDGLVNND